MYGLKMQFRAKLILPESAAMIMCGLMAKIVKRQGWRKFKKQDGMSTTIVKYNGRKNQEIK